MDKELDNLDKQIGRLIQEIKQLKEADKANKETNAALKSFIEKLQNDLESEKKERNTEVQTLNEKFDDLKRRMEELEGKTKPSLRQVAFLVEQEIWRYVLPDKEIHETCYILQSMEKWLETNTWKEKGQKAQRRWLALQKELKWHDEKHKRAITILQQLPLDLTELKDVDLEEARKQLKDGDYVPDAEKESCEKIIDMIITARKLNSTKRATNTHSSQPFKKLKSK